MMKSLLLLVPLLVEGPLQQDLEIHFAPTGEARRLEAEIEEELNRAGRSIRVAVFHFTSRRLARALERRARAGVSVRVLLDERQSDPEFVKDLRRRGLELRRVTPRGDERASFHHKYCVVDEATVITGSYNWTVMGDRENHENVLILRRRAAARAYAGNFDRLWNDASLSRP